MGERICFATSQWKDAPNKPSCYTQAQWDAINSSKFNGAPFANCFAASEEVRKEYDQVELQAYASALEEIKLPGCEITLCNGGTYTGIFAWLQEQVENLPEVTKKDITVKCEDTEMTVWDGSTYFELKKASKTFEWRTCTCIREPDKQIFRAATIGLVPNAMKAPSKRSDTYIPVCGPGTHIKEITKEQMVQIVWRVSQLDMNASGFSVSNSGSVETGTCLYRDQGSSALQEQSSVNISMSAKVSTSNKNLNPSPSAVGKESSIINSTWDSTKKIGYEAQDARFVSVYGDIYYEDGPAGTSNGNVDVSASISPNSYKCGYLAASSNGSINITLNPFNHRHQYIYFVGEKIYFDPTGLFNFYINLMGDQYYLNPYDVDAPYSLTLIFLGISFTLGVSGPPNGAYSEEVYSQHLGFLINPFVGTRNFSSGGNVTITAKKYYPYANSNGEPIYNEDTGAQLKDPLS